MPFRPPSPSDGPLAKVDCLAEKDPVTVREDHLADVELVAVAVSDPQKVRYGGLAEKEGVDEGSRVGRLRRTTEAALVKTWSYELAATTRYKGVGEAMRVEGGGHERMEPFHLLSRSMRDLLCGMLSIAPECRPSMAEVAEYFSRKEPWLASDEKKRRGRASSVPPRVEGSHAVLGEAISRDDTASRKSLADVQQVGVLYRAPAGVSGGSSTASSAASSRTASPLVVPLVAPISRRSPPAERRATGMDAGGSRHVRGQAQQLAYRQPRLQPP